MFLPRSARREAGGTAGSDRLPATRTWTRTSRWNPRSRSATRP